MPEIPRWPGLQFVGAPLVGDRTLFTASADTKIWEIHRDLFLLIARKNGAEVTPALFEEAVAFGKEKEAEFLAPIRARGVPEAIEHLFTATRKRDVERIARDIVITPQDLVALEYTCHRLGLSHHSQHFQWVPEARGLTDAERDTLFAMGEAPASPEEERVVAKVRQGFVEREHRSVHMYAGAGDAWHCIFLSFEDTADHAGNHWRGGAHVHFVNHTFDPRRLTKKRVWKALQEREYSLPKLHVRFHDASDPWALMLTHPLLYADPATGRSKKIAPK